MHETLRFGKFEDAENVTIIFQTYSKLRPFSFENHFSFCFAQFFPFLIPNITIVFSNS